MDEGVPWCFDWVKMFVYMSELDRRFLEREYINAMKMHYYLPQRLTYDE